MSNEARNAAFALWPGEEGWTLDEAADACGRATLRLVALTRSFRARAHYEIERRRRGPGGQQAGSPRWSMVPMSVLCEIERDCRHALEGMGIEVDPVEKEEEP